MLLLNRKRYTFDETFTFFHVKASAKLWQLLRVFSAMSAIASVQGTTSCPALLTTSSPAKAVYGPGRAADCAEAELKHCHVMFASTLHGTALASDNYCSSRWCLATVWGYTVPPAGSRTEAIFWVLAGDGSRVSSCAVPLVLQVRKETWLLNWLAQIWLEASVLGWVQGFEVTLIQ